VKWAKRFGCLLHSLRPPAFSRPGSAVSPPHIRCLDRGTPSRISRLHLDASLDGSSGRLHKVTCDAQPYPRVIATVRDDHGLTSVAYGRHHSSLGKRPISWAPRYKEQKSRGKLAQLFSQS